MKNIFDTREFWKTMKPFLSDKKTIFSQISKETKIKIISDNFYLYVVQNLEDVFRSFNVKPDEYYLRETKNLRDPVEITIRTFENRPSYQAIKQNILVNQNFYFCYADVRYILKETTALNNIKNSTFGKISTKRLKEMSDICKLLLTNIWNKK